MPVTSNRVAPTRSCTLHIVNNTDRALRLQHFNATGSVVQDAPGVINGKSTGTLQVKNVGPGSDAAYDVVYEIDGVNQGTHDLACEGKSGWVGHGPNDYQERLSSEAADQRLRLKGEGDNADEAVRTVTFFERT